MSSVRRQEKPRPWRVHPIWRGIGCVMIVLIPIISYAIGDIVTANMEAVRQFFNQMGLFRRSVDLLAWMDVIADAVPQIAAQTRDLKATLALDPIPYFWGKMLICFVLSMVLFAFLSILYSIIFTITGPSPYGQMDVKPKRYKRRKSNVKRIKY